MSPLPGPARLAPHLGPAVLFAALAVLLTWPAVTVLGAAIPGAPTSDAYDHYWGYGWWATSLAQGDLPLRTTVSHWPDGGLLWFVDPLGALLSLPVRALAGPGAAYSIALMLQVWLAMVATYGVTVARGDGRAGGVLAAVAFGGSPYVLSLLYSGTVEYLALWPLPVFWHFVRRALGDGSRRAALLAAGAWALATLGNFYYAAFCGLLGVIAAIDVVVERRDRRSLLLLAEHAATVLLAYAVFAGPILAVAGWTLTSPDSVVEQASAPGWSYQSLPATDLYTFLHPGDYYFPDNRKFGNFGIIHVNYLGWGLFALAMVAAWRHPGLRIGLLLALILALGPTLAVNGAPVLVNKFPVPLPDTLLYLPGSPFRFVHHPYRIVVLPMLLGALAVARLLGPRPWLALGAAAVVLVETLFVSPAVWPLPTANVELPSYYEPLRDDPQVKGIWDFPPNHHVSNRWYQALAVGHGKVIPYGVNQFLPDKFAKNHLVRTLMYCLRRPALATIAREGGRPLDAFLQRPVASKVEAGRAQLVEWGYGVVVVHHDALQPTERACTLAALGGVATEAEGATVVRLDGG